MAPDIGPLVRLGLALHWLPARKKAPSESGWQTLPVATLANLKATYKEGMNVGVRLGEPSKVGNGYLHAIDVDIRKPDCLGYVLKTLDKLLPDWERLPRVRSGSGGDSFHLYMVVDRPLRSRDIAKSVNTFRGDDDRTRREWEIDLMGTGKQIVLPPSIHPVSGLAYEWVVPFDAFDLDIGSYNVEADDLEAALAAETPDVGEQERHDLTLKEMDLDLSALPLDEWCDDRTGWRNVGMAIHFETNGSDEGYRLWTRFSQKSAKFDPREQKKVWRSFRNEDKKARVITWGTIAQAARSARALTEDLGIEDLGDEPGYDGDYAGDVMGVTSEVTEDVAPTSEARSKTATEKLEASWFGEGVPANIRKLNRRHAVARVNGSTVVLDFKSEGKSVYGSTRGMVDYYNHIQVPNDEGKKKISLGERWLKHPNRRTYSDIVFDPTSAGKPGQYNMWQGFAIDPHGANGSCEHLLAHIRDNICDSDPVLIRYFLGWFADMVQNPGRKPGVAVALRGNKGVGKDIVGYFVRRFFPTHYYNVSNMKQIHGQFNQHLERTLFLHGEEVVWGGNKAEDGQLKSLITSPTISIEPKGVNAFQIDSYLRIYVTSNERWVVPATGDERRYFVLDVPDRWNGNRAAARAYFKPIWEELENGGAAAFLNYLLNYDLDGFDIGNVPATDALQAQKEQGLRNVEAWWYETLMTGEIGLDAPTREEWEIGPITIPKDVLRGSYADRMRTMKWDNEVLHEIQFTKRMKHLLWGSLIDKRGRRDGHGHRTQHFSIPSLGRCRDLFIQQTNIKVTWPEEDPDDDDLGL